MYLVGLAIGMLVFMPIAFAIAKKFEKKPPSETRSPAEEM